MSPTVAPEACAGKFFPSSCFSLTEGRRVLWVTQPLHAERCHSFFSPWLLLSVPLFGAWTSTQNEYTRLLFGDGPDGCSATQPAGDSCAVSICHVPPSRGYKHFLGCLLSALQVVFPSSLLRGSGTSRSPECISVPECGLLPFSASHLSVLLYHKFFGGLIFATTRIWLICCILQFLCQEQ